jgi:hypothetical protein
VICWPAWLFRIQRLGLFRVKSDRHATHGATLHKRPRLIGRLRHADRRELDARDQLVFGGFLRNSHPQSVRLWLLCRSNVRLNRETGFEMTADGR